MWGEQSIAVSRACPGQARQGRVEGSVLLFDPRGGGSEISSRPQLPAIVRGPLAYWCGGPPWAEPMVPEGSPTDPIGKQGRSTDATGQEAACSSSST